MIIENIYIRVQFLYIYYLLYKMDLDNKTLTLFKSFINDICKVFPEHKESLTNNYNSGFFIALFSLLHYFK